MEIVSFPGIDRLRPSREKAGAQRRAWQSLVIILGICCLTLTVLTPALAGDGALDPSFDPGAGVASSPMLWGRTNYTDFTGKWLITGSFKHLGGYDRAGIARMLADGSVDPNFNAAVASYGPGTGFVNQVILLSPGDANSQILIGGDFVIDSNSGPYYGLARLNHDGTVDSSFTHVFSTGDGINALTRQSDGKLYVGGYGLQVNGYPGASFYLLRLDANGNVDPTYPMRSAPGGMVYAIWPDSGAAGQIRLFGDIPRFGDPQHLDHMLLLGADGNTILQRIGDEVVNGTIIYMTWQGSNIIIAGAFTQVYDSTSGTWKEMNRIARLLPTGGLDPTFNIGTGANGHIKRVTVSGGLLMLNGNFTSFNGAPCGRMVALNATNGAVMNTFGTGADDRIWNVFRQDDGTWTVMGAFQNFNGSARQCLASLATDLSLSTQFQSFTIDYQPTSAVVYAMQQSPQGTYIAGAMSQYGGKLHRRVARLTYDAKPDQTFLDGMGGHVVYSLATQLEDGKLLVAGHFGQGEGYVSCTSLARLNLDGTMDLGFRPVLAKANGAIPDLYLVQEAWDGSGHIYVGGDFAAVADATLVMQARSGLARLNADGTLDGTFTFNPGSMPGLSNIMITLVGDDTGGSFPVAGKATYLGSTCGFAARLLHDGSLDPSFANGPSPVPHVVIFNGEVKCATGEGGIILGGEFTQILDGVTNPARNRLARFSDDGILDPTYNPAGPDGPIYAVTTQWYTNKIIIGGLFTTVNGVARNNLARLKADGSLDPSFDPGAGPDDAVHVIQWNWYTQKALIGGAFSTYAGVNRSRIAQIFASDVSFNAAIPLLLLFD